MCDVTLPDEFTSLAARAGVAVLAGAHFRADALAAVHAVRQADGTLAAVAVVTPLTTTFCTLSDIELISSFICSCLRQNASPHRCMNSNAPTIISLGFPVKPVWKPLLIHQITEAIRQIIEKFI